MAARGVVEMTSRISRDEEDEASLWQKKVKRPPASRDSGRWLTGDRRALAAALRRENAGGEMKCGMAWGDRPGYI
jgi:hypothetical protein